MCAIPHAERAPRCFDRALSQVTRAMLQCLRLRHDTRVSEGRDSGRRHSHRSTSDFRAAPLQPPRQHEVTWRPDFHQAIAGLAKGNRNMAFTGNAAVQYTKEGRKAWVHLNRPEAMNAINGDL